MKKKVFSVITALALSFSSMNAAGIPVIDAASITQMVTQYNQMLKEYEQMLKDTSNFEKQMGELGVGMSSVGQILGEVHSMVQQMENIYDSVVNIPQNFLKNVEKVTSACSFLQTKSAGFKDKLSNMTGAIKDDYNRCLVGIKNNDIIEDSIGELMAQAEKVTDMTEYSKIMTEIDNIRNAQAFLQNKSNEEQANKIIAFYETYHGDDVNNPYSKSKMTADLKQLSKALAKDNNQKQAQALSNTILIKILESLQRQYELNVEYNNALAMSGGLTGGSGGGSNSFSQNEQVYQQEYEEPEVDESFFSFNDDSNSLQFDENGLPIFVIGGLD